jgi:ethanolamine transporter EutH
VNETNANTRRRVRRVTRILREIDPWSVFKVAIVFHFVLYIVVMVSLVLLWNVANATGTINNIENFLESFGWDSFEFKGGELFRNVWILGLFAVVLATGIWVLLAVVFNLITELVGGIRVSVLEEEVVERVGEP